MQEVNPALEGFLPPRRVSALGNASDYGIPACTPEDLAVSSRDEAVAVLRELLAGRGPEAMRNMLALNVGMSIYLLEGKLPLATCIAKAREALASGVGGRVLHAA